VIQVNESTLVAARSVDIIRVAKAIDKVHLEVQVWCGTNCLVAGGGYDPYDGAHVTRARALVQELAAKVDHELSSQRG
jgi:hypothetical protein